MAARRGHRRDDADALPLEANKAQLDTPHRRIDILARSFNRPAGVSTRAVLTQRREKRALLDAIVVPKH